MTSLPGNLGCRFFPFNTLNISCHSLLACRVSSKRSAVKHMVFPLYVTCCFSLTAFNTLSLCLIFVNLISMCLDVFLLGFVLYGTLCFLHLIDYFLSCVGKISNYSLFKIFLIPFIFLFFWDLYNSNVHAFNIVPDVSETILCFFFFSFFLLYSVIQQLFPPFYLPAHLSILLP